MNSWGQSFQLAVKRFSRRTFIARLGRAGMVLAGTDLFNNCSRIHIPGGVKLENEALGITLDNQTGLLAVLENKLTNQRMAIRGDDFEVEAEEFQLGPHNARLGSLKKVSAQRVEVTYHAAEATVAAVYKLGSKNHFFEKHLVIISAAPFRLKHLVVSHLAFPDSNLQWVKYAHLKCLTYFGRTAKGGIFLGVELPFDTSKQDSKEELSLGYAPSLKIKADERLMCEPIYCGVYQRGPGDAELPKLSQRESLMTETFYEQELNDTQRTNLPLHSESKAMVALASTVLGYPRERLGPVMNGWLSEMDHAPYRDRKDAATDLRATDFAADCGINLFSDARPWAGGFPAIGALRGDEIPKVSELTLEVAAHAREQGVKWQLWHSLNNTDPWSLPGRPAKQEPRIPAGHPYRLDKPDWLTKPVDVSQIFGHEIQEQGNCFANAPFFEWLVQTLITVIESGHFEAWAIDGDFLGGPGIVRPADCPFSNHDHLPGDSNYVCERNLTELARRLRERYPNLYMSYCRPPMDLGVWSLRHVDAVFTIDEYARPIGLPGVGPQPLNVLFGDKIRTWSRIRVERQFFPHYLDAPQVFGIPHSYHGGLKWESAGLDYIMLSALACSPNQLYYLPTQSGMPDRDKQTIKKWLDWGRKNIAYLMVRKDLPEWPKAGKVDGFAHVREDRGFVFLFNPNPKQLRGVFHLDEAIGLMHGEKFDVAAIHPDRRSQRGLKRGVAIRWEVPPREAALLEIRPA
jgi:hypothetical protein